METAHWNGYYDCSTSPTCLVVAMLVFCGMYVGCCLMDGWLDVCQVFKRLYENTTSDVHVSVHLAILESIRDVCKRVVKELTSWVSDQLLLLGFRVKLRELSIATTQFFL
jgi:hypothetical protein